MLARQGPTKQAKPSQGAQQMSYPPMPTAANPRAHIVGPVHGHTSLETAYLNPNHPWRDGISTDAKHWVEHVGSPRSKDYQSICGQFYKVSKLKPGPDRLWTNSQNRNVKHSLVFLMVDSFGMIYPWAFDFATMSLDEIQQLLTWFPGMDENQRLIIDMRLNPGYAKSVEAKSIISKNMTAVHADRLMHKYSEMWLKPSQPVLTENHMLDILEVAYLYPHLLTGGVKPCQISGRGRLVQNRTWLTRQLSLPTNTPSSYTDPDSDAEWCAEETARRASGKPPVFGPKDLS